MTRTHIPLEPNSNDYLTKTWVACSWKSTQAFWWAHFFQWEAIVASDVSYQPTIVFRLV